MPPRPSEQPSVLLDAMLAYLPVGVSRDSPDWLFRNLFLRRLPAEIRSQLMDDKNALLQELAERADKMWSSRSDVTTTALLAVCTVESAEEFVIQQKGCDSSSADTSAHQCCAE